MAALVSKRVLVHPRKSRCGHLQTDRPTKEEANVLIKTLASHWTLIGLLTVHLGIRVITVN